MNFNVLLKMSPELKQLLLLTALGMSIGLVLLLIAYVAAGAVGYAAGHAIRVFTIEDKIHGEFWPLVTSIDAYCSEPGSAPGSLDELVPAYIIELPHCQ